MVDNVINNVTYIGKESNNLEESEVIGVSDDDLVIYGNKTGQKITDAIRELTLKQAKKVGISERNMHYLKGKVKRGEPIVLKKKTVKRLLKV